jgi:hypothetical protein
MLGKSNLRHARKLKTNNSTMKPRITCLLLSAVFLAGCWQKSLNPFYTTADVAYEGRLIGAWHEQKDGSNDGEKPRAWTFTEGLNKGYKLEIQEKDETHSYAGHFFKLDGYQLLDIIPAKQAVSTIPAHHLFKVVELEPNLKLAMLDIEWMQEWLRKNPGALAHIAIADPDSPDDREQDELVLTAETQALQKFLKQHWNEPKLFSEPIVLKPAASGTAAKKN